LKSIEEIATAVAIALNLVRIGRKGGNTNLTVLKILKIYAIKREKGSGTRLSRVVAHPTTRRAGRA
jgi:hypothetical protein